MNLRLRPLGRLPSVLAALVGASLLVAACGGGPSGSPGGQGPAVTALPDIHLSDPTRADEVYTGLHKQLGQSLVGTNTVTGTEPLARINASFQGQPVAIIGYSSDLARAKLYPYRDGTPPDPGNPTYTWAGSNVVVEFGSSTAGRRPPAPDSAMAQAATQFAAVLDRLIGPLDERSAQRASPPKPAPAAPPAPTQAPSASAKPS